MNLKLENRKTLVTASSDGIGKGIAKVLSEEGAQVTICSRDQKKLEASARDYKTQGRIVADIKTASGVRSLIEQYEAKFGTPEILVINTAGPPKGKFADLSWSDWSIGFETIWAPAVQLASWALPQMKTNRRGRIIFSTSLAAKEPMGTMLVSGAMRAGISNFVRGLAREVGGDGVTVNAVLPGWTNTAAVRKMGAGIEPIIAQVPIRRLVEPEEIGSLVAFLVSDAAAAITGQAISVDGGILHGV